MRQHTYSNSGEKEGDVLDDLEQMFAGSAKCDFCGSDEPSWVYPADSFISESPVDGRRSSSEGGWVACAVCKSVVDEGSTKKLVDHAIREFFYKRPGLAARLGPAKLKELRREIAVMYQTFKKSRHGKAVPFG